MFNFLGVPARLHWKTALTLAVGDVSTTVNVRREITEMIFIYTLSY